MITWALFVILLDSERYYVMPRGHFVTMEQCFDMRDAFIATAPEPKINYEAVCIQTDQITMK